MDVVGLKKPDVEPTVEQERPIRPAVHFLWFIVVIPLLIALLALVVAG